MSSLKKHWGKPSSDLRPLHRVLAVGYLALLRAWKLQGKKTSSQKIELFLHQAFRGNLTTNDCPLRVFFWFQGPVDPSVMYNEISPQADGYFYIFLWVTHVWITLTCHAAELLWRFYARTPLQWGNAVRKCFDDPCSLPSSTGRHGWDNLWPGMPGGPGGEILKWTTLAAPKISGSLPFLSTDRNLGVNWHFLSIIFVAIRQLIDPQHGRHSGPLGVCLE